MKRSVIGVLCSGALIAVVGCGGGSLEEGTPKDTTPGVPLNSIKADMGTPGSNKPPPQPKDNMTPAVPGPAAK